MGYIFILILCEIVQKSYSYELCFTLFEISLNALLIADKLLKNSLNLEFYKIQEKDRFYMVAFVSIWLFVIEKIDVDSDVNEAQENVEGYCHTTSLHAL